MSGDNVEIVRMAIEASNAFMDRGDPKEARKAAAELAHPQAEVHWHDRRTMPDSPQHLRGAQDALGLWQQVRSAWADLTWEPLEFIEASDGGVLTPVRQTAQGRASGVPIVTHPLILWTIRDRKVREIEFFRHRAQAFEAAGLVEQAE